MEKIMSGRPQRNRRHSRRAWPPEDDLHQPRLVKRLFTPEIKRMLKDWLVRRRENPYPSRDEKKRLAIDTGLTYTQICNWFANWRRKLKNSERERNQKSWGHLIKHYNTNARGNVEQFSISSEDSIWEEDEMGRDGDDDADDNNNLKRSDDDYDDEYESREDGISSSTEGATTMSSTSGYMNYVRNQPKMHSMTKSQFCYNRNMQTPIIVTATSNLNADTIMMGEQPQTNAEKPNTIIGNAKYKQKIMEKYLRDTNDAHLNAITQQTSTNTIGPAAELDASQLSTDDNGSVGPIDGVHLQRSDNTALTKWLESAARFTPDKNNYFIEWNGRTGKLERKQNSQQLRRVTIIPASSSLLQRKVTNICPTQLELDAAEALANMAFNCRQRMMDCTAAGGSLKTVNAISS